MFKLFVFCAILAFAAANPAPAPAPAPEPKPGAILAAPYTAGYIAPINYGSAYYPSLYSSYSSYSALPYYRSYYY
ncbi:neuropeptide-like 4 [Nasonia vitripennis]|uniref:Neuropeptide-like 4 n=1 Tax=Nasonia vitripennis TaxID=7425 RepID=A0A7M7G2X5_NASVI|nr:neuropeptide-like 4 [Nasonia vitripennis]